MSDNNYDLIVIGGGPAGMTAAIYAKRAGMTCIVLEKTGFMGGQVLYTEKIDNYPGFPGVEGMELAGKMQRQAEQLEVTFQKGNVNGIALTEDKNAVEVMLESGIVMKASNVIIATGAARRKLGIPGEDRLAGKGVSYCATCDGAFYRNKTVYVVGGGDSAVGEALHLSKMCTKVYMVHRRARLRASAMGCAAIEKAENIEVLYNTVMMEISGKDRVDTVRLNNVVSGEITEIPADGVFVAVGMEPQTSFLAGNEHISLDEAGYVIASEDGRTDMPHVYVAGDARTKRLRQIVTAVADGAACIHSIEE